MSLEEREGVVDRLTDKGVVLSGTWFGCSKHLKGPRLTEAQLGHKVTVLFHTYDERPYIDVVKAIGEKVPGWKPPENPKGGAWQGGGRRLSPEEIALKREEGARIARSVAIDRATVLVKDGIPPEKVAALALVIESYIQTGTFSRVEKASGPECPPSKPSAAPVLEASIEAAKPTPDAPSPKEARPSSGTPRPRRADPKAVNALFNEAKLGGLVSDWSSYLTLCRGAAKSHVKSPYGLSSQEFAKVEADLRGRLARGSASRGKVA